MGAGGSRIFLEVSEMLRKELMAGLRLDTEETGLFTYRILGFRFLGNWERRETRDDAGAKSKVQRALGAKLLPNSFVRVIAATKHKSSTY